MEDPIKEEVLREAIEDKGDEGRKTLFDFCMMMSGLVLDPNFGQEKFEEVTNKLKEELQTIPNITGSGSN